MTAATDQFLKDFIHFSQDSMQWCAQESEKSTRVISDMLDMILAESKRVSNLSQESLQAVKAMQTSLNSMMQGHPAMNLGALLKSLHVLSQEHQEIQGVINPIIESLQFQDRLRQNLENLGKMMDAWMTTRSRILQNGHFQESDFVEFGKVLMANTTMGEERDAIRRHIAGLPNQETDTTVSFF